MLSRHCYILVGPQVLSPSNELLLHCYGVDLAITQHPLLQHCPPAHARICFMQAPEIL